MKKPLRSLGKIESKLLTSLASQDKNIFGVRDAQEVTGGSLEATHILLSDLVKKKWLVRLVPGTYLIVPLSAGQEAEFSENWYVIAKSLVEPTPYYISHYSALDIHEITTQPVLTVYVSTPIRKRPKRILGATFRFLYIPENDLWGVEDIWITPTQRVKVSDLERTIIDCLNRPDLSGGISEVAKGIWSKRDSIDYQKLVSYVKRLTRKQQSVAKRLGFILDTYQIGDPTALSGLRKLLSPSYTLLDPSLEPRGKFVSSWKIHVNVDPEELREIPRT